jgi:N utilization substance protein A
LASKLVDWDIEIMTHDELNTAIEKAEEQFTGLGMSPDLVEVLIEEGFLSYEDVGVLTPSELVEMGVPDEDTAEDMILAARDESSRVDREARFGKPRESQAPAAPAAPVLAPAPVETQTEPSRGRQAFENLFAAPAAAEEEAPATEQEHSLAPAGEEPAATESSEAPTADAPPSSDANPPEPPPSHEEGPPA